MMNIGINKMFVRATIVSSFLLTVGGQKICYFHTAYLNEYPACNYTTMQLTEEICKQFCGNHYDNCQGYIHDLDHITQFCYMYFCDQLINTSCTDCPVFIKKTCNDDCDGSGYYSVTNMHPMCDVTVKRNLSASYCRNLCHEMAGSCQAYRYRNSYQSSNSIVNECFIYGCKEMISIPNCSTCYLHIKQCIETNCTYASHGNNTYGNCSAVESYHVESEEECFAFCENYKWCLGVSVEPTSLSLFRCALHDCNKTINVSNTRTFHSRSCPDIDLTPTISIGQNSPHNISEDYENVHTSHFTTLGDVLSTTDNIGSNSDVFEDRTVNTSPSVTIDETCHCVCQNVSLEEYIQQHENALNSMKIDKSNTSRSFRMLTSVRDDRPTSKSVGSFAVAIIVTVLCLMIINDLLSAVKKIRRWRLT